MSENMETAAPVAETAPVAQPEPQEVEAQQGDNPGDDASPDEDREGEGQDPKPKGGFQRRISELVHAREDLARDRDYWRDLALQQARQPAPQQVQQEADGYEYDVPEQGVDPNAIILTVRQQLEREQRLASFTDRVAKEFPEGEPEGIAALKRAPGEYVTPVIFDLVTGSDLAPKVADYLGMNQTELRRLASLPPHRLGLEFARIEARLAEQRPAQTKAPQPPPSVGVRAAPVEKDPDQMTTAEWLKWREAQLRK